MDELGRIVDEVIAANADAVSDVRAGKAQAIGFLVGQVMKATRGQANAAVARAAIQDRIGAGGGG
jgi:aspartyl-tRNA(Asn)/glutamyl-tRNA(Gln) amidotransferase subunit B